MLSMIILLQAVEIDPMPGFDMNVMWGFVNAIMSTYTEWINIMLGVVVAIGVMGWLLGRGR